MKPNNDFVILHSDLAQRVSEILAQRGMKVGIAESCTGGLLSYHLQCLVVRVRFLMGR